MTVHPLVNSFILRDYEEKSKYHSFAFIRDLLDVCGCPDLVYMNHSLCQFCIVRCISDKRTEKKFVLFVLKELILARDSILTYAWVILFWIFMTLNVELSAIYFSVYLVWKWGSIEHHAQGTIDERSSSIIMNKYFSLLNRKVLMKEMKKNHKKSFHLYFVHVTTAASKVVFKRVRWDADIVKQVAFSL